MALASGYNSALEEIVRAVQLENDLPNLQTADAKGLPLEGDNLHLSTPAQVQLGKMLADAFLNNLPKPIQWPQLSSSATFFFFFGLDDGLLEIHLS